MIDETKVRTRTGVSVVSISGILCIHKALRAPDVSVGGGGGGGVAQAIWRFEI